MSDRFGRLFLVFVRAAVVNNDVFVSGRHRSVQCDAGKVILPAFSSYFKFRQCRGGVRVHVGRVSVSGSLCNACPPKILEGEGGREGEGSG